MKEPVSKPTNGIAGVSRDEWGPNRNIPLAVRSGQSPLGAQLVDLANIA